VPFWPGINAAPVLRQPLDAAVHDLLDDPSTATLFSGEVGAVPLPDHEASLFVEDLRDRIPLMEEGFHRPWMPSTLALRGWVARVRPLAPQQICPQHGSIFRGAAFTQLLDWLEGLEVGQWSEADAGTRAKSAAA
jgi:flavorubredoxin